MLRARGALVAVLLIAAAYSSAIAAPQPSFSCAAAKATVEKLVCSEPILARLDAAMAAAYRGSPGERAAQRQWLAGRAAACPTGTGTALPQDGGRDAVVACLQRIYEQRIAVVGYDRNRAAWPKLPFRPRIVDGKGKKLCEAIGRDIEASFLGPGLFPNPLGEREIGFAPLPNAGGAILRADFDPYNRGRPGTVLQSVIDVGATRLAQVRFARFTPAALASLLDKRDEAALRAFDEAGTPIVDVDALPAPDPHRRQVEPVPWFTRSDTLDIDEAPDFFRFGARVYVLAPLQPASRDSADVGVYELSGPTNFTPVCRFVGHVPISYFPYEPAPVDQMAVTATVEGAAGPLLPTGKVCDAYGDGPRTLWDHRQYRPWLLDRRLQPYAVDPPLLARYLRASGLTGLERRRQYLAYEAARERAVASLAPYYVGQFGRHPAEAARLSALYYDWEVAYGAEIDPNDPVTKALTSPDFTAAHALQSAVFAGDREKVAALLAGGAKTGPLDEPLVTDALDQPALLQALLDRGLSPNDVGASGRTPLMTAARLDLIDAARLLLARGAAVEAAAGAAVGAIYQTDHAVCQHEPAPSNDTPGRTALSYAAELASPELVRLLLDQGADPHKPDIEGRLPADYAKDREPVLDLLGRVR